jgi:hypothetical protein
METGVTRTSVSHWRSLKPAPEGLKKSIIMTLFKNQDHALSALRALPVHFALTDEEAIPVCIAGTFNQWPPDAQALRLMEHRHWVGETILPIGDCEYCPVVDGEFSARSGSSGNRGNPFGGRNSILKVVSSPKPIHCSTQELFLENWRNK